MPKSTQSEGEIFDQASTLPKSERTRFLQAACAGDPELQQRVQALLAAHEEAGDFLGTDHLGVVQARVRSKLDTQPFHEEVPGATIGRYKLLQKIGEGGCGVVYMAEQQEPVQRTVALKVIKLGMDTKAVIGRFEAESQALAMMEHANIAKVFDGGATEKGRPFFVMELVRGLAITKYCDEQNLSTAARLELFMKVCHAVQHAHQKGIIHRDLKPSNILVTLDDGSPVPKVIDFGIAKATQGRLTDNTVFTAFEQFIGTPAYMSPEQAEMSGLDIDTRSDVYSLGVLLYELLTGCQPFEPTTLLSASLHDLRRMIREEEPPRPSVRLATLGDPARATLSRKRGVPLEQLAAMLRGDLDWIVMRAIEKDRRRRYAGASDLALDIQRYLGSEPVWARPPTTLYRFGKYARRHRTALIALTGIFVALIAGLAVALAGMRRAIAAQHTAENAQAEAETVYDFYTMGVGAANSARANPDLIVREVLDKASPRIAIQFAQDPLRRARIEEVMGELYQGLNSYEASSQHLKIAADLRTRELGRHHPLTLRAYGKLARILVMTPEIEQAIPLATDTIAAYERVPQPLKQDLANAYSSLSFAEYVHPGLREESLEHAQRAARLFAEALGPAHPLTISAQVELVFRLWSAERFEEGLAQCRGLLKVTEIMADHPLRGQLFDAAALLAEELGDYPASAEFGRQDVEFRTSVLPQETNQIATARFLEAFARAHVEDPTEHVQAAEKILHRQETSALPGILTRPMLLSRMALLDGLGGRIEDAVKTAREANEALRNSLGETPFAFRATAELAMLESQAGDYVPAEQHSRALLDALSRAPHRYEYSLSRAKIALATALIGQTKFEEAEKLLTENQSTLTALHKDIRQQLTLTQRALAEAQQARDKHRGAE